ncbi:SCAN domain-containing protein 3-like [Macrobrachium rosenbergii]|uniref:SCAN domain-containing protein 3-like n=1 Tax=Macrobrachium rosenbergii TaxID=79674 RepID=UPI0034D5C430
MTPMKMKRHLTTKHKHLSQKPVDYFKRLLKDNKQQRRRFEKKVKVAEKTQEASYLVAEQAAKHNMKPYSVAEPYFLPTCAVVKTLFGDEAEKEVKKTPLSDDTIGRRIKDMASGIEKTVSELMEDKMYALQADESTDIGDKSQLLVFIRYIADNKITEQFLCCKELVQTSGQGIFSSVAEYLKEMGLTWKLCVGICTDGCPSMVGSVKGFVSLAQKENPLLITTHCFLHRENLIAKTHGQELKLVLESVVQMVSFIKSRPKQTRLFSILCEEMGSAHEGLLHAEVRWLSRDSVVESTRTETGNDSFLDSSGKT